jgi:hypothetical protein
MIQEKNRKDDDLRSEAGGVGSRRLRHGVITLSSCQKLMSVLIRFW